MNDIVYKLTLMFRLRRTCIMPSRGRAPVAFWKGLFATRIFAIKCVHKGSQLKKGGWEEVTSCFKASCFCFLWTGYCCGSRRVTEGETGSCPALSMQGFFNSQTPLSHPFFSPQTTPPHTKKRQQPRSPSSEVWTSTVPKRRRDERSSQLF